jgi:hypothetical protein
MESKLARQLKQDLVAAVQRMSTAERLEAFLSHSRLMAELQAAARRSRTSARPAAESTGA